MTPTLTPTRILLIDDDPVLLEVLADMLRFRLGALVEPCESGLVGLERLSTGTYDLIISDIKMPRMGIDLPRQASGDSAAYPDDFNDGARR